MSVIQPVNKYIYNHYLIFVSTICGWRNAFVMRDLNSRIQYKIVDAVSTALRRWSRWTGPTSSGQRRKSLTICDVQYCLTQSIITQKTSYQGVILDNGTKWRITRAMIQWKLNGWAHQRSVSWAKVVLKTKWNVVAFLIAFIIQLLFIVVLHGLNKS